MTVRVIFKLLLLLPLAACSGGLFGQKEAMQAEEDARRGAVLQMERKSDQQRARMDMLEGEMGLLRRDLGLIRSDIIDLVRRLETDVESPDRPEYKKRTLPVNREPLNKRPAEDIGQKDNQDGMADAPAIPSASDTESDDIQYGLHLASYRNLDRLSDGWDELRAKYPDLLADLEVRISVLDMGSFGGIYHRLKAGPFSDKGQAEDKCRQFQAAGEYCVVAEFTGDPLS